jgi:hypothetical protein
VVAVGATVEGLAVEAGEGLAVAVELIVGFEVDGKEEGEKEGEKEWKGGREGEGAIGRVGERERVVEEEVVDALGV